MKLGAIEPTRGRFHRAVLLHRPATESTKILLFFVREKPTQLSYSSLQSTDVVLLNRPLPLLDENFGST